MKETAFSRSGKTPILSRIAHRGRERRAFARSHDCGRGRWAAADHGALLHRQGPRALPPPLGEAPGPLPATLAELTRPQVCNDSTCAARLGRSTSFSTSRRSLPSRLGHTGWTGTSMWLDPGTRTFVILSNRNTPTSGNAQPVRSRIVDRGLGDRRGSHEAAQGGPAPHRAGLASAAAPRGRPAQPTRSTFRPPRGRRPLGPRRPRGLGLRGARGQARRRAHEPDRTHARRPGARRRAARQGREGKGHRLSEALLARARHRGRSRREGRRWPPRERPPHPLALRRVAAAHEGRLRQAGRRRRGPPGRGLPLHVPHDHGLRARETAALAKVEVVVLDRPNPINAVSVEGPMAETNELRSWRTTRSPSARA
jgi:hypothetical protein